MAAYILRYRQGVIPYAAAVKNTLQARSDYQMFQTVVIETDREGQILWGANWNQLKKDEVEASTEAKDSFPGHRGALLAK